jgi:hypothetical protein
MTLNIRAFCPQLSIPVIKQRINARYQQIIGLEEWAFLNDSTTVRLYEVTDNTSSQSVAVTQDSTTVTGTSTTWDSEDIDEGWFFRVGTGSQPYIVSSVDSDTQITLETAYAEDTDASADFTYWKGVYSPSVGNVSEIISIVHDHELPEKSQEYLNSIDPERSSEGSPTYWRTYSKSTALGIVSFEIWPIPDDDYTVTVYYKKTVDDLSDNTDTPIFRSDVLEAGALWDCYRMSFAITQNPAYIGMARDAAMDYQRLIRELIIEDLGTSSLPRRVRDVSGGHTWDNNFWTKHDVE